MAQLPPIVYAVMANDEQLVLERVRSGLDINFVDPVRSTALSAATARGNASMIKLLLAHGADPKAKDRDGKSSYDYIRIYECVDALGVLGDPRYAWIKPIKSKPTELPIFASPRDFDRHGGDYESHTRLITGITAHNVGSAWVMGDDYHVSTNTFIGWRGDDAKVRESELLLLKPVMPDQSFRLPENSITRLLVRLNHDQTRAAVVEIDQSEVRDEDLSQLLVDYQKPQIFSHPVLGTLTLDRKVGHFAGSIPFGGSKVDLHLDSISDMAVGAAVQVAKDPAIVDLKLREIFKTQVLTLKNESWLDDDEPPITPERVSAEAMPSIINVSPDGDLAFWCGGSDWFAGHSVVVRFRKDGEKWDVDLVG